MEARLRRPAQCGFPDTNPYGSIDTTDGPRTVKVWNSGNQPLLFAMPATGNNPDYAEDFPENAAEASLCTAGLTLAACTSCDVSMNFMPSADGVNTGSVGLSTMDANHPAPTAGGGALDRLNELWLPHLRHQRDPSANGHQRRRRNLDYRAMDGGPEVHYCQEHLRRGVAMGKSCSLQVKFSPVTVGAHGESLALQTNGKTNPTVILNGTANVVVPPGTPPAALVSPTYLPFGAVALGASETIPVTVTNIGGGTLTATPRSVAQATTQLREVPADQAWHRAIAAAYRLSSIQRQSRQHTTVY